VITFTPIKSSTAPNTPKATITPIGTRIDLPMSESCALNPINAKIDWPSEENPNKLAIFSNDGNHQHRDKNHQAAHRGRAFFDLMCGRAFNANPLANVSSGAKSAINGGPQITASKNEMRLK